MTNRRLAGPLSLLALPLAALSACDAQEPPGYHGDTLATLQGLVVDDRTVDVPPAKIVLTWGDVGLMFRPSGVSVPLVGTFPEAFTLELFQPPPADRLFDPAIGLPSGYYAPGQGDIAVARILAVKQSADETTFILPGDVVGGAEGHALIYVARDVVAGSAGAVYLGGPVSAGFHIARVAPGGSPDQAPIVACENTAADTAAWKACGTYTSISIVPNEQISVRLVDDLGQLDQRYAGPTYVTPGSIIDPGPCVPSDDPMAMPCQ